MVSLPSMSMHLSHHGFSSWIKDDFWEKKGKKHRLAFMAISRPLKGRMRTATCTV
jgi:hypothetical protein